MPRPLEEVVGYRFKDAGLLKQAMSHKSFASESGSGVYNERLEFLGDSVLASVVAHAVFSGCPNEPEGNLSKKKSLLVSRPSLALWGEALDIGSYLHLGVGEESTGGRTRHSLLANAVEALIGAIYLDGGYEAAAKFIRAWYAERHGSRRVSILRRPMAGLVGAAFDHDGPCDARGLVVGDGDRRLLGRHAAEQLRHPGMLVRPELGLPHDCHRAVDEE